MLDKPSFKNLISKGKRCIVFLNGFYEWRTENKIKQRFPFEIRFLNDGLSSTVSIPEKLGRDGLLKLARQKIIRDSKIKNDNPRR